MLRPDTRYYVKLDNPATFEQAVAKAQMVEQLLAEATPSHQALATNPSYRGKSGSTCETKLQRQNYRGRRNPFNRGQVNFSQQSRGRLPTRLVRAEPTTGCFNCEGDDHFSRQCPSPRVTRRTAGKSSLRSSSSNRNYSRILPRDGIPPSRYDRDRELSQALSIGIESFRRLSQIRALSISLQENQSALERSDARVKELVKRNEELANFTFEQSSYISMPQVELLFAVSMLLYFASSGALLTTAWLCPRDPAEALARIPTLCNCSWIIPPVEETKKALSVHIYRPNTRHYDTAAHLYKVVTQSVTLLSLESCKLMIQHHKCECGSMTWSNDFWATSNSIII
ncbi:unnamed protein product [Haemonchus placei]|uniref:CCHC-type domain-containing protein n=1 Tax=Haemonchus placei TaxID=6290 RepID=A0A3P7UIY8_HAEPC|nr:unnamed protein product [Haemonchus placei]